VRWRERGGGVEREGGGREGEDGEKKKSRREVESEMKMREKR
jgi:hypothetical protein